LTRLEKAGIIKRRYRIAPPKVKERILKGVALGDLPEKLTDKQKTAVDALLKAGKPLAVTRIEKEYGVSQAVQRTMINKGILKPTEIRVRRMPHFGATTAPRYNLTAEQTEALERITEDTDKDNFAETLLFGVTAGGKTEVYLRAIEHVLAKGKTAMVLLPEIALTTQIMNVFRERFGDDVAVLHSALSHGERYDEWQRIANGEAKVVLGPRSAVFAPVSNLGIIIIDEEHEDSYKQEDSQPRYNGKDVARIRAKRNNALLLLGSATPSMETFYRARQGEIGLITITKRVADRPMPKMIAVDMKSMYKSKKVSVFTPELEEAMRETLAAGKQIMLLQNRRAFSTMFLCRDCGYTAKCPNCSVSLKYRKSSNSLVCHYCDHSEPASGVCPNCGGTRLGKFGIGTERVEEEAKKVFPEAKVLRLDRDTTTAKGSHEAILSEIRESGDILVGTQMIAKGLDFPGVTLVGIISADTSLGLPDFRAGERTFRLLAQVGGRAGRGEDPGTVIVQTFDPENTAVERAMNHDYVGFYESEIGDRAELGYPPFTHLATLLSSDEDEDRAMSRAVETAEALKSLPTELASKLTIIGPAQASLGVIKNKHRFRIILKSPKRETLVEAIRLAFDKAPSCAKYITPDIDPTTLI
ncbi:MAG: primosomal protein N', partial [Abditibacteriota bacterium]|nr:primosomal protein N' [Abditibacteriota bacterium]